MYLQKLFTLFLVLSVFVGYPTNAAIFDWFWSTTHDLYKNGERKEIMGSVNVPYELKTEDEKFLEEALKFTDIMKSSALDVCQHNIVLKIKTSCSSMTEEELAKMSVNLLNCQSAVDGRKTFPCSESMSLKECTIEMDADMWSVYHIMNNRARAVCLAARREQFQALSEMTVNRLLSSAQEQIKLMYKLNEGQEELETLTTQTMGAVREGNIDIMQQQEQLKNTHNAMQNSIFQNLRVLSQEKSLIAAGNRELDAIKLKLDATNKELSLQSLERIGQHQQVVADIEKIQSQAAVILQRIEESTANLMVHHETVAAQYHETLNNLEKINKTVGFLTQLFTATHIQLEERIEWIKSFLGESGEELAKVSTTVLHIAYLLMGMLVSSFLLLPFFSRVALTIILPLNLLMVYDKRAEALSFSHITILWISFTIVNLLVNGILSYRKKPSMLNKVYENGIHSNSAVQAKSNPGWISIPVPLKLFILGLWHKLSSLWKQESPKESFRKMPHDYSINSSTGREPEDNNVTVTPKTMGTPRNEPAHNRVSRWIENSRFTERANTPLSSASVRSGSPRAMCGAICKTGRQCRKPSTPGREFCKIHEAGSSIIG